MSNILSVSATSSFSASPVDAGTLAQDELDPRFVEELQGAMGQQEPPSTTPAAGEEKFASAPEADNGEPVTSLQNLPLMPWVAMALPANFAPSDSAVQGAVNELNGVEGVSVATAPGLLVTASGTPITGTSSDSGVLASEGVAQSTPGNEVDRVASLSLASAESNAQDPSIASPQGLDQPEDMTDVTGLMTRPVATSTVAPTGAPTDPSGGPVVRTSGEEVRASRLSSFTAAPTVDPGLVTNTDAQSRSEKSSALDVAVSAVAMNSQYRESASALHTASSGTGAVEPQASSAVLLETSSANHSSVKHDVSPPSASVSIADNASAGSVVAMASDTVLVPSIQDAAPTDASQVIAAQQAEAQYSHDSSDVVNQAATSSEEVSKTVSATVLSVASAALQTASVAAPSQVITTSTQASSLEVTPQVMESQSVASVRVSTRRNDLDMGADVGQTAHAIEDVRSAATTVESTGEGPALTDAAVSRTTAKPADEPDTAAMQSSVMAAKTSMRQDQAMAEARENNASLGATIEASSARMVSQTSQEAGRTGSSDVSSQEASSAESTFASSFVQALMGQVHHTAASHSQPLEVLPSPAPIAPHQVRFDAGQVQVEVVRLVKQGGGQVVMELTPPDESKFKIDLTISQQGVARLVVDGASESTRLRLEQTVSGLQDQFQQMGLQLQLDMRQPHQQESRAQAQSQSMSPENVGNGPRMSGAVEASAQPLIGRPTWEQGQVYLVA